MLVESRLKKSYVGGKRTLSDDESGAPLRKRTRIDLVPDEIPHYDWTAMLLEDAIGAVPADSRLLLIMPTKLALAGKEVKVADDDRYITL